MLNGSLLIRTLDFFSGNGSAGNMARAGAGTGRVMTGTATVENQSCNKTTYIL